MGQGGAGGGGVRRAACARSKDTSRSHSSLTRRSIDFTEIAGMGESLCRRIIR